MKKNDNFEISSGNVFKDIGLDQSDELIVRSNLLMEVSSLIEKSGLSQAEVAKKLGITQPKVSMLVKGRLSAFSTDTLLRYLSRLGCKVEIRIHKPRARRSIFKKKGGVAVK